MLKFFEPEEIEELDDDEKERVRNQKLDEVTEKYNHNYGNCILTITHKRKFNRNIYIPAII